MSRARTIYDTSAWKYARGVVLRRDRYECRIRLPGCRGVAKTVDHVVELQDGGAPYDLNNLQAACWACNVSKRNRTVAARAARAGAPPPTEPTVRKW